MTNRNKQQLVVLYYVKNVPVHHHGGKFPIANDLIAFVRLFHAIRDKSQFLKNRVQFLLHPAKR